MLPRFEELIPLLPGIGAALLVAAVAAFMHRRAPHFAAFLNGFFVAVAVAGAWYAGDGIPDLSAGRALNSSERALAATLVFALIGGAASPARIYRLAQFALSGGLVWYLLRPLLERAPTEPHAVGAGTALLVTGGVLAFWMLLEDVADRTEGWATLGVPGLILGLYAQTALVFGSAKLATLLGAASLALFALAPFSRWLPGRALPVAAVGGAVGATAAFSLDAWFYGVDPAPPAKPLVAACLAPIFLYFTLVPGMSEKRAIRFIGPMVLVIALLAWSGWRTWEARPVETSKDGVEDMSDWYK